MAEGSRVPGASPRLGTLIFKMGIVILVPQSCWKRWLPGGPTVNITLPLIKCQLFIRKISHDLRGWHTYESDTHIGIWQKQKKTLCFMRFILSPPLRVFIWWFFAFCCLCLCAVSPCSKLASHAKGWEMLCTPGKVTQILSDYPMIM